MKYLLLLLLLLPSAYALVDPLQPADQAFVNSSNVTFEYYVSMQNLTGCTVHVDSFSFPDPAPVNDAINDLLITSIDTGQHNWNVSCANTSTTEVSVTKTFTIDNETPTLAIVTPDNGEHSDIQLDIIPNDNLDTTLDCTVLWQGAAIDTAQVTANTHYQATYAAAGTGTLEVTCTDDALNSITVNRTLTITPSLFLTLTTDKPSYGITETGHLTINSLDNANVTVDICPNEQGFVECVTALIPDTDYPQTITLPYMNVSREYLVDGIAQFGTQIVSSQTTYRVDNSLTVDIIINNTPKLNETSNLTATASGGIAPYTYEWNISNGTIITGASYLPLSFNGTKKYNITLTATDAAGNTHRVTETINLDLHYDLIFEIRDNQTQEPINGATVELNGTKQTTVLDGRTYFSLPEGEYKIFISAPGYRYLLEEIDVADPETFIAYLEREEGSPLVQITSPTTNATVTSPTAIKYSLTHTEQAACTLLLETEEGWLLENGTMNATGTHEFSREFDEGEHAVRIECVDSKGKTGASATVQFSVGVIPEAPPAPPVEVDLSFLDEASEEFATILENIKGYAQKEKEAVALIKFDKQLRNTRRAIQQAIRDLDSTQFRTDLDDAQKEQEQATIIQRITATIANTPKAIEILDTLSYVAYVDEENIDAVVEELTTIDGMTENTNFLRRAILEDQQKFTITSQLMHVEIFYKNGSAAVQTIVEREFTYGENVEDYSLIELIPKKVIDRASRIIFHTDMEILQEDPIIRFGQEEKIVYIIPKKVSFSRMKEIRTILARTYAAENKITGYAIFTGGIGEYGLYGGSLLAIIILLYLCYYFDIIKQIKYIRYRFGKNEQVHYLRVLIGDIEDQLQANNYEKAELLYKEVRLSYDAQSELAQNDLYEDVMAIVQRMDNYYFNMIMIELDHHLKAEDMHGAINAYEKLVGTFERLDRESQQQLVQTVSAMAKRLGVHA
ncbi:MAG: hypothetical protein OXR66_07395 [Candidatus Woesearchaeota archaeon]|nr:hypothetical protein [Candidatus Woesearchaeota archaeon]